MPLSADAPLAPEAESPRPLLSVVLATRDPWPAVRDAVDELLAQLEPLGGELVLADGSERALPAGAPAYREVRWLKQRGASIFALRALAIEASRGAVVGLTEDHCVVGNGWCRRMVDAHRSRPEAAAVGGPVENAATARLFDWAAYLTTFSTFIPPVLEPRDRVPPPCNLSYKRAAIPGALAPGHVEFVLNPALDVQRRIELDDRIRIAHKHSLTPLGHLRKHFNNGRATTGTLVDSGPSVRRRRLLRRYLARPLELSRSTLESIRPRASLPLRARLSVPLVPLLCCSHAAGEIVGIVFGAGRSLHRID